MRTTCSMTRAAILMIFERVVVNSAFCFDNSAHQN
jgi:hypothetical protein